MANEKKNNNGHSKEKQNLIGHGCHYHHVPRHHHQIGIEFS